LSEKRRFQWQPESVFSLFSKLHKKHYSKCPIDSKWPIDRAGTDQSKQPKTETQVTVETLATNEPPTSNVLSVPAASEERRPSIELIPALCDLGRAAVGDALLASEEDSMSEADSPSGVDDQSEQSW